MSRRDDRRPADDVRAVRRDDQLIDLVGRRAADLPDDPAALLLRSLTDDVDEGLAALLGSPVEVRPSIRLVPGPTLVEGEDGVTASSDDEPPAGSRWRTRGTTLAVVVAATLTVSGAAAAVTGDPLAPYRAVISFVDAELGRPPAPAPGAPERAAAPSRVLAAPVEEGQVGAGAVSRAEGLPGLRLGTDERRNAHGQNDRTDPDAKKGNRHDGGRSGGNGADPRGSGNNGGAGTADKDTKAKPDKPARTRGLGSSRPEAGSGRPEVKSRPATPDAQRPDTSSGSKRTTSGGTTRADVATPPDTGGQGNGKGDSRR